MAISTISGVIRVKKPLNMNIRGVFIAGGKPLITKMVNTILDISTKNFPKIFFEIRFMSLSFPGPLVSD